MGRRERKRDCERPPKYHSVLADGGAGDLNLGTQILRQKSLLQNHHAVSPAPHTGFFSEMKQKSGVGGWGAGGGVGQKTHPCLDTVPALKTSGCWGQGRKPTGLALGRD